MIYNHIPVTIGCLPKVTAAPINFQYDQVQILQIEGIELPESYRVDFCNPGDARTISMVGTSDGVEIPNQLLATGLPVIAYVVLSGIDENAVETRYQITIPVTRRPAASDIQPTPAEQSTIDSLIDAMNDAVEAAETAQGAAEDAQEAAEADALKAEGYALGTQDGTPVSSDSPYYENNAEYMKDAAAQYAFAADTAEGEAAAWATGSYSGNPSGVPVPDDAPQHDNNAYYYKEQAAEYAQQAAESAGSITGLTAAAETLAPGSSATASFDADTDTLTIGVPTGATGAPGQDGQDGADGVSPEVTIETITGGHSVTITDADHPGGQTFDVMDGQDGAPGVIQSVNGKSAASITLDAGDIGYDATQTYTSGSVGTELQKQNSKFDLYSYSGLLYYDSDLFQLGSLDGSGNPESTVKKYRISTKNIIDIDQNITLVIASGFRIYAFLYLNDIFQYSSGAWVTNSYPVPAGYGLKFVIARVTENTSEVADIPTFAKKVSIGTTANAFIDGTDINLFAVTKSAGGYLNTSGNRSNDQYDTTRTSDFIETLNNTEITIQSWWGELPPSTTQWHAICFYDASKTLIGSRSTKTGANTLYQVYTISVPQNAVYARVSSRVCGNWKLKVQYGAIATPWSIAPEDQKDTILGNAVSDDLYIKSINHRGWYNCPENTLVAFKNSKLQGFNYVETDVRYTSDGVPVLLHDASINRTARNLDGTSISSTVNIADITYEQALNYDFGIYMGSQFSGTKIPTLKEFLRLCKNLSLKPYIELKDSLTTSNVDEVLALIAQFSMSDQTTLISTQVDLLTEAKTVNNSIRIGLVLNGNVPAHIIDALSLRTGNNSVFIANTYTNSYAVIDELKTNGLPLEMWTIDNAGTLAIILTDDVTCYVSGIISGKYVVSNLSNYLEYVKN